MKNVSEPLHTHPSPSGSVFLSSEFFQGNFTAKRKTIEEKSVTQLGDEQKTAKREKNVFSNYKIDHYVIMAAVKRLRLLFRAEEAIPTTTTHLYPILG